MKEVGLGLGEKENTKQTKKGINQQIQATDFEEPW